ncbi:MAG: hypothetical protein ACJ8BW_33420 [Ktedonobacteraceae bacterium]
MRPNTYKAWLSLDPFNNPHAPPGTLFMPQYKLSLDEQAKQLEEFYVTGSQTACNTQLNTLS